MNNHSSSSISTINHDVTYNKVSTIADVDKYIIYINNFWASHIKNIANDWKKMADNKYMQDSNNLPRQIESDINVYKKCAEQLEASLTDVQTELNTQFND